MATESKREIRIHGRGGQGVVISAEILVMALVAGGSHATGLPMFSGERRGAPVTSFVRFSDNPIREKTRVYFPDCVIVMDAIQLKWPWIYAGLKTNGTLLLNSSHALEATPHKNVKKSGVVDATQIALEELGRAATNTCMLGAFSATTGWVGLDPILLALENYFSGEALRKNVRSTERGYKEVKITEW